MKKALLALLAPAILLGTAGCSLSPARIGLPLDNFLVQIGVGAKILPKADDFTLLRLSPLWLGDDYVALANLSAVSFSDTNNGVALGGILSADNGFGVSLAAVDHNRDHIGFRLGGIVCGGKQRGFQIGLINYCNAESTALQIGVLNFSEGSYCPLPLLRLALPASDEELQAMRTGIPQTEPIPHPEAEP